MKNEEEHYKCEEVDILGSIEFDLTEAIKDLIWNIKTIKEDVDNLKNKNNS